MLDLYYTHETDMILNFVLSINCDAAYSHTPLFCMIPAALGFVVASEARNMCSVTVRDATFQLCSLLW